MQKIFSVIIVSYCNYKVLADCLDSIEQMNDIGDGLEVIVVEQSPTEEIYNKLKENYQNIVLLRAENKGFGAGNNRGVEVAQGKYLLFLNSDTIMIEPIFKFAIDTFEKDDTLGCFGVQLLAADRSKTAPFSLRMRLGLLNGLLNKILLTLGVFLPKCMYIQGADMFIPKAVFEAIGCFDEKLFMYCEESDICNRINSIGKKIKFFKSKHLIHLEGKSSDSKQLEKEKLNLKSWEYYCDKYGLNFKKIMKSELKYLKLKRVIFKALGWKEKADAYNEIINYMSNMLTATSKH